jgi:hypothetical protein
MNRAERLIKIEATICPVCDAQPGNRCEEVEGMGNAYFHLGRGRVAEALYTVEEDPSDDALRMPYEIFGTTDPEVLAEPVTVTRGMLAKMVENLFLYQATLNMIQEHPNIWQECENTVGIEKGFLFRSVKGDDDTPDGIERIPDPEPDPDEVEYTVAEVILQQYKNREDLIADNPGLFGLV